ncbi:MAG: sodium:solute symporter family protein, partial [Planctomycetota bacterium]
CARLFVVLIVGVTFVLSLFPRAVFDLGLWSFSGFTGLFPLVFASIYWKRLTAAGAIASVIVAGGSWFYLFQKSEFGKNAKFVFPESPIEMGPVVIPPMLSVTTIFVLSAITLVAVSWATKPPKEKTLRQFDLTG